MAKNFYTFIILPEASARRLADCDNGPSKDGDGGAQ